jgi:hypothetical protein
MLDLHVVHELEEVFAIVRNGVSSRKSCFDFSSGGLNAMA